MGISFGLLGWYHAVLVRYGTTPCDLIRHDAVWYDASNSCRVPMGTRRSRWQVLTASRQVQEKRGFRRSATERSNLCVAIFIRPLLFIEAYYYPGVKIYLVEEGAAPCCSSCGQGMKSTWAARRTTRRRPLLH